MFFDPMPANRKKSGRSSQPQIGAASTTIDSDGREQDKPNLPVVPVHAQQRLLDSFSKAFEDLLHPGSAHADLDRKLQQVKTHLFHRNFGEAFGDPTFLRAYAVRWSSSRALAYVQILSTVFKQFTRPDLGQASHALCLGGGGGAEMLALATLREDIALGNARENIDAKSNLAITVIDIADWTIVLDELCNSFIKTSSRDTEDLVVSSIQRNLLDSQALDIQPLTKAVAAAGLITMFFTLNELFSESLSKTQTLLLDLTSRAKKDCLLVVVDSAGSYSTVAIGRKVEGRQERADLEKEPETRKYPMAWLLDHVLLKLAANVSPNNKSPWTKLESCDSRWFRLPGELRYPIKLEDMRYQLHVFQHD